MDRYSISPAERARKAVSLVLQRMQDPGSGVELARKMGVSETTISRTKNDYLEHVALLIGHLGLKVVPAEFKCVDPATYEFLTRTHQRIMQEQPQLVWDVEED